VLLGEAEHLLELGLGSELRVEVQRDAVEPAVCHRGERRPADSARALDRVGMLQGCAGEDSSEFALALKCWQLPIRIATFVIDR
jgi:hypothetical protein